MPSTVTLSSTLLRPTLDSLTCHEPDLTKLMEFIYSIVKTPDDKTNIINAARVYLALGVVLQEAELMQLDHAPNLWLHQDKKQYEVCQLPSCQLSLGSDADQSVCFT
jgi:hypothetical protein